MALFALLAPSLGAQAGLPSIQQSLDRADAATRVYDLVIAESEYRSAIAAGSLQIAQAYAAAGDHSRALEYLQDAAQNLARPEPVLLKIAESYIQLQKGAQAEALIRQALADNPEDPLGRQLLASAYHAGGREKEALDELNKLAAQFPEAADVRFQLASIHLSQKNLASAQREFAQLLKLRPGAATHVFIGRVLRDMRFYDEAEKELQAALALDPTIRRANYYLGSIAILREGVLLMEQAARYFSRELAIAPDDYLSHLNLGITYNGMRKFVEAIPHLRRAAQLQPDEPDAHYFLGNAYAADEAPAAAIAELQRVLELTPDPTRNNFQSANAHYILAQSLRRTGREQEAQVHFDRSRELRARAMEKQQRELAAGMGGSPAVLVESGAAPDTRAAEAATALLTPLIARANFNLGMIYLRGENPVAASTVLYRAARRQPDSAEYAYWLGVARYQTKRYKDAVEPLRHAFATGYRRAEARELLSMALFNDGQYANAAQMLRQHVTPASDPALLIVYGTALVRSGDGDLAARIFSSMLARNQDSAELHLLLAQAHAQQNRFDEALAGLQRALELDPKIPEANLSLGQILIRQGELLRAEQALRNEIAITPANQQARYLLGFALDLQDRKAEAESLLQQVLAAAPQHADARYLMGKLLLERGDAAGAAVQLESAARLDPQSAPTRYQLAQAYTKLGKSADAEREFAAFRELKSKERTQ